MTDNDLTALQDFLAKLKTARLPERDPVMAKLIDETFLVQPEAAQLLVIKCLLQQRALNELRAEIESLRSAPQSAATAAPGATDDRGWFARLTGAPPRPAVAAQPMGVAQPQAYGPAYGPAYGSAGGGVLGSIATTAGGVVAGEFLFEGIEHLLHGNRGYGYGFGGAGLPGAQPVIENVTVNEYGPGGDSLSREPGSQRDSFFNDDSASNQDIDFDDSSFSDSDQT